MSDSNTQFLQTASAVMSELDVRYMEADLDGKVQLKEDLDRAMMTFSEIRCKILEKEVVCTPDDVAKMQALHQEVEAAAEIQTVLAIAVRLTRMLAQL
jgi:hypothetical protein